MSSIIYRRLSHSFIQQFNFQNNIKCFSTSQFYKNKNPYGRENVKSTFKGYVFTRYIDYVQNYDKLLEKKFPSAVHVYRVFLLGVKEFYNDMKTYLKVTRIVNSTTEGFRALRRKEIELYYQLPRDMKKVAPVLLLSSLPFANYVVFPLAYMYPRHFLTSHFWSIEQKTEFQKIYLTKRLSYTLKVFRCLQEKSHLLKLKTTKFHKWNYILGLLSNGLHPTAEELLLVKDVFTEYPYHLNTLTSKHVNYLCNLHGIHSGLLRRARLAERSYVIHHMDLGIKREGGVHNLPPHSLRYSCYLRGLNTENLSNEDMIKWLEDWVRVSLEVDGSNISMFLHLPIFIGYNHPNNWRLIFK